jgi:methylglutaconyl-CoA hydratase
MSEPLIIENSPQGITTLTLNQPDRHNALSQEMIDALLEALTNLKQQPVSRVLILAANGKSFCSGADLVEMRTMAQVDELANRNQAIELATLMHNLYYSPIPSIVRVNGPAFGGALGLIACCDFAVASEEVHFAFTELQLGLVPAVIAPYIINAMGPRKARQYFLSGERFSATKACDLGLIDQFVAPSLLDDTIMARANALLLAAPGASAECKRLIEHLTPFDAQMTDYTADLLAKFSVSAEGIEGLNAFFEKRKPRWLHPAGKYTGD